MHICPGCICYHHFLNFSNANSYKFHGSIVDAYDIGCEMQKKRIECAIMIQAALADDNEEKETRL